MKYIVFLLIMIVSSFNAGAESVIRNGAERINEITEKLAGKRIALVANQTSLVGSTHLLDTLCSLGHKPKCLFAPEHGFRGKADAGETVKDGKDIKTGTPIISLYGKNKKPSADAMKDIDIVVFDIQDVGARFYTYISTLYYVMQSCAENNKELLVLDRPNPCDYVDGPVLKAKYKSFVGILPIPVLHGCTIGEIAGMINGEGWLGNNLRCKHSVIKVEGWRHGDPYSLPVKPSPNLPNDRSIELYPSLCLFEATSVSVGRGTYFPFQVLGSPLVPKDKYKFSFTPKPLEGFDKNPLHKNTLCYGLDLREENESIEGFSLRYIIQLYNEFKKIDQADKFITRPQWFDLLMGTNQVRLDLINGKSEAEIRSKWDDDLRKYRQIRSKYLLYE